MENTSSSNQPEMSLKALIDTLKVSAGWDLEANKLAGTLYHKLMESRSTQTISEYLNIFESDLEPEISQFLRKNITEIENVCVTFKNSATYTSLTSKGILSAIRLFDTYVLRCQSHYESPIHMYVRMAAFFTHQTFTHPALQKTLASLELQNCVPLSHELDFFVYFFDILSSQLVSCATPVMRSAGLKNGYLASCFIMNPDMSSEEKTLTALFQELSPLLGSKSGVGINVTQFDSNKKSIHSCLKLINAQVEFYNDNNIRPVSVAAYMELWHEQIEEFLAIKLPENPERCQSIFQGVCIPSLFFKLYEENPNSHWYLFNPTVATKLQGLYGEPFEKEYFRLVKEQKFSSVLTVKSLMFALINTIIKTGSPYILCKDFLNVHHWNDTQENAISYANLCAEVIQQPGKHTSTCNLANICLPVCLRPQATALSGAPGKIFCFKTLNKAVRAAVIMINACILGGACPTPNVKIMQSERSMGIGVQGLADVFAKLGWGYMDESSAKLDRQIFETMYYRAVKVSNQLVTVGGGLPHENFQNSMLHKGLFHWDLYDVNFDEKTQAVSSKSWEELRKSVIKHGTFNCQFIALMPTAGTSQITGFSESFYPFYANVSSKVSNKEEVMRPNVTFLEQVSPSDIPILRSVSGDVTKLPKPLFEKYKNFMTAFDYTPESQIERAKLRAPFVDQSQSFSLFLKETKVKSASYLKNLLLMGHRAGLKTIMYYCRIQKQTSLAALECLECTQLTNLPSETCPYNPPRGDEKSEHSQAELTDCLCCQ
nr:ribonucleotide reductase subunit 1 [Macronycteris gammaherpesvirus 1]